MDPIDDSKIDRLPFVFVPEFLGTLRYVYTFDWRHGSKNGCEGRSIEPSTATAELGVAELEAAGLVERVLIREGSFGHSLTPAALEHAASIAAFSGRWRQVSYDQPVWLAAAIGDWPAAHAAASIRDCTVARSAPSCRPLPASAAGRCRPGVTPTPAPEARSATSPRPCCEAILQHPAVPEEFREAISLGAPAALTPELRTDGGGDDVP